jgi:hypothetical protein
MLIRNQTIHRSSYSPKSQPKLNPAPKSLLNVKTKASQPTYCDLCKCACTSWRQHIKSQKPVKAERATLQRKNDSDESSDDQSHSATVLDETSPDLVREGNEVEKYKVLGISITYQSLQRLANDKWLDSDVITI